MNISPSRLLPCICKNLQTRSLVTFVLFAGILCLTLSIRIQGSSRIPHGQFTGPDAYFYYRQAQLISEHAHLPERDMLRWLPIGRDLGQTLNLYGYVLAYTHKVVTLLFPKLSLYHVAFYAPVVCFCIGLGVFCIFLYHIHGLGFSCLVGVLLTTLPGSIGRSSVGFADRDSWCFLLGILTVTTYLISLQAQSSPNRFLWTLTSGGFMFLGGMSWEAFGVFGSIILVVEIWRFLSSETEEGLGYYILWVCAFVPTLYLASPAYRSGYGFAEHLFTFLLVPPVVFLGMRALRHLLLSNVEKLQAQARPLALGLTLAGITMALFYVFIQLDSFVYTTVLSRQNTLMQTVSELQAPRLRYWIFRYGSVFILGSIGFIIASKKVGHPTFMLAPFTLFALTTFFREPFEKYLWNASQNTLFFSLIVVYCAIAFLLAAVRQKSHQIHVSIIVAFTAWFLLWGALARDARRYDLFLAVALAFFTTEAIQYITHVLGEKIWHSKYMSDIFRQGVEKHKLKTYLILGMVGLILFWPTTGGHARRTYIIPQKLRPALPGDMPVTRAFQWMKSELSNTAIVAAPWRYGSMLNVLGGVKTIIDQDHYIQHWIHLYNQYVQKGSNPRDALEFLKAHNATHLMITLKHPPPSVKNTPLNKVFLPVYPTENFEKSMVKVWKIHYPPDIQPNPKYLETKIPEIDAQLQMTE